MPILALFSKSKCIDIFECPLAMAKYFRISHLLEIPVESFGITQSTIHNIN